jgi:hypothetical protein
VATAAGSATKVTFKGKEQNLHELWDTGLLETERGSKLSLHGSINSLVRMSANRSGSGHVGQKDRDMNQVVVRRKALLAKLKTNGSRGIQKRGCQRT